MFESMPSICLRKCALFDDLLSASNVLGLTLGCSIANNSRSGFGSNGFLVPSPRQQSPGCRSWAIAPETSWSFSAISPSIRAPWNSEAPGTLAAMSLKAVTLADF